MNEFKKYVSFYLFVIMTVVCVDSIPTSLLADTKDILTPINNTSSSSPAAAVFPTDNKKTNHDERKPSLPPQPQKRGVNSQYYDEKDLSKDIALNNLRNGIWADVDSSLNYPDTIDVEDYQKSSSIPMPSTSFFNNKIIDQLRKERPYESVTYEEPIALPLQYPSYSRYYGDRRKRSSTGKNNLVLRLKRESKLSSADMLALLALIESNNNNDYGGGVGAIDRLSPYAYDDEIDDNIKSYLQLPQKQQQQQLYYAGDNNNNNNNNNNDYSQNDNGGEWWNSVTEPNVQYYPQYSSRYDYDVPLSSSRFPILNPSKRYMVAKRYAGGFDTRYNTAFANNESPSPFRKHYYE